MKFNFKLRGKADTKNYEGAKAFSFTPEMELYTAVATTMLNDATYESADKRLTRIIELLPKVSPAFVAKLAVYARTQMNLRSAPVVLSTELAKIHNGDNLVSNTLEKIVQRPDEITEVLAYYQMTNERKGQKKLFKISKQVQKGLAASFNKFDEYQFAKYNRATEVKLRDALFLVHPKAKDDAQQTLFNKIAKDELTTPYTWETELSAAGQMKYSSPHDRKMAMKTVWELLIDSGKMGYMATLRNLRNILEAQVSAAHVQKVCDYLMNEKAVAHSKQLPFRFLAAYRELKTVPSEYTSYVMTALETALEKSVANMQGFELNERVVVACDVSGSMQHVVSPKSKVLYYDIGLLMGMMLQSKCKNVVSGMFGDSWKIVPLPTKGILANVDAFYKREGEVGYSTNGYLVLRDLCERKYRADKVMMFTDVQMWDSTTKNILNANTIAYQWAQYKKIAPQAKLYIFDLAGYGNAPLRIPQNDVYLIAGWSDKIFSVLEAMENGADAMEMINAIAI
ncbi:TROVE domain-containing protein [Taibaiella soli]|uniref:TROVE domain-containing protein n=1 Tax=Taibaiella soli TaxID=1649169 RepID=A0A2W2B3Q5_9BACT|nr:TROVE domain-containing protein [Taibaiella soli]PZF74658.1 TROVE domain-containing protein [Taibaiella soli]